MTIVVGMRRLAQTSAVIAVMVSAACGSRPDGTPRSSEAIGLNNKAVGLLGRYEFDQARRLLASLVDQYPDWVDARVNLAIATLNRQHQGDNAAARALVEAALKSKPDHLGARYLLGILDFDAGRAPAALAHFQTVARADPEDAYVAFHVAQCLFQIGRYAESLEWYRRSISLDAFLRNGHYGAYLALQRLGREAEARPMLEAFRELEGHPQARMVELKYTRMGPHADARSVDLPGAGPVATPEGSLFGAARTALAGDPGVYWRAGGRSNQSSLTVADINGDGQADLFVTAVSGDGASRRSAVLLGRRDGEFVFDSSHPLSSRSEVNAAIWGDYDNDGLTDVYLCRDGPNQLWRQAQPGFWSDVTAATGTAGGRLSTVDGAMVDADHDGDLDLFLVNANGPNELLNNDRNGTFRPIGQARGLGGSAASRAVVIADLDRDRDADLLIVNHRPPHEVYLNGRAWRYDPAPGFDALRAAAIDAAVAGDIDADGYPEIFTAAGGRLTMWTRSRDRRYVPRELPVRSAVQRGRAQLALADVDGDGRHELVASVDPAWQVVDLDPAPSGGPRAVAAFVATGPPLAGWTTVLLDPAAGPSIVGLPIEGAPTIWPVGPGRHRSLALAPTGKDRRSDQLRSNVSGIGTILAVRTGSRWTIATTFRSHSGPGQSLEPVSVGLGGARALDFVQVTWSDGVYQTEVGLEAGLVHPIEETQRQLSSCPVLFAFDGVRDRFVTDVLGGGGVGFPVSPGVYGEPDPDESVLLPDGSLVPKDGRFRLKVGEPMEEVLYLDHARLAAYDLPPGWQMTLDERKWNGGPRPDGRPRFYRRLVAPLRATDGLGVDVTEAVRRADLRAAQPGFVDRRFIGLTAEQSLTMNFDRPLDEGPGPLLLVADGWIEYPYAQTVFAAWQAGAAYRAPTVEALDDAGRWRTVLDQFGYPAGMPRQMSVPLDGLPPGARQLRLRTNQEIYWDRIAVAYAEPSPEVRRHELPIQGARVAAVGFPARTTGTQRRPHYEYDRRAPVADTRHPSGFYTAFGPAGPLVAHADDAVAIIGPGEEVHLEFGPAVAAPPEGWTRRFVVELRGWCKDMDLYTRDGETVEPIPASGKPPDPRETLHRRFNTRYAGGR